MPTDSNLDELFSLAEEKYKQVGFEAHVVELLTPYVSQRPDHSRAWFLYGHALLILGRPREAEDALLKALEGVPDDLAHSVYFRLASLYESVGSHAVAEEYYGRAVTTSRGSRLGWFWILRGANLAVFERYDEAIQAYLTALELPETHEDEAYLNLGKVYRAQGKYELAASAYQSALDLDPTYAKARNDLNGLAGIQESINLAHACGSPGTSPLPANRTVAQLYDLAKQKHQQVGCEAHVVELLTPYLAERQDHAHAWWLYGDALRVLGRGREAEQALMNALEGVPDDVAHSVYVRLAMLHNSVGRHDIAEEYYDCAARTSDGGSLGWIWIFRGRNLADAERFDEAIEAYLTALELPDTQRDEAYLKLGYAYRAQGKYDLAASAFQSALDHNPTSEDAREGLNGLAGIQESVDLAKKKGISPIEGEGMV